jgi:hypothetical protein
VTLMRLLKHLFLSYWLLRQKFPRPALAAIEAAVRASESSHMGELRVAIEGGLPFGHIARGIGARARAIELFSFLRVWDTEANSGVLIYLLLADRRVEILADRGIHARVGDETWNRICTRMQAAFKAGEFEAGVLLGVNEVGEQLSRHFPVAGKNPNELSDRPVIL